eukprot:gene9000-11060_t
MRPADVWMVAVQDARIAAVAATLAATLQAGAATSPLVFHCSGAQNASSLQPLADLGWRTASAHCILSFADVPTAVQQFAGTACALEGDASARAVLEPAFAAIGARCFAVASEDKVLYHAAAVFATNFLPVLQAVAEDAWQATGVPAELLPQLRASLLRNAVDNITRLGPAHGSQPHGLHCEILLRMRTADGQLVSPGEFMPAVERYHLAARVDRWVIKNALAWMAEHQDRV